MAQRDTVPSSDSTSKDTSMVFNVNSNNRVEAFDFKVKDTIPSDTAKKDSTMAFNDRKEKVLSTSLYFINNDWQVYSIKNESILAAIKRKKASV